MARAIDFTYGTLTIGKDQGDSSYHLTDKYTFDIDDESATLAFEVLVSNATRASFLTAEANLVAAYSAVNQDLTVQLSDTNRHVFSHSSNTGFLSRASCVKLGGDEDTGNSARYRCTVVVQLPANATGYSNGFRVGTVDVSTSGSGKRRVTLGGTYTALSSNSARTQYEAQVASWASTQLTAIDSGASWGLSETPTATADDQDKVLTFTRSYEELVLAEGTSNTDESALRNQSLVITRTDNSAADSESEGSVGRLIDAEVRYRVDVDKDTYSGAAGLRNAYAAVIRPHIINQATQTLNATRLVVVSESFIPDLAENSVSAVIRFQGDPGYRFLTVQVEEEDEINHGLVFVPVWDGNPYRRDAYQGIASHIKRRDTFTLERDRGDGPAQLGLRFPDAELEGSSDAPEGFFEVTAVRKTRRESIGLPGDRMRLLATVSTRTFVRADIDGPEPPKPKAGGLGVIVGI